VIEAIIGLIGVVLGFGLSTGYQELKERRERKKHKAALMEELRANLHMIPQKRQTITNVWLHQKTGGGSPNPWDGSVGDQLPQSGGRPGKEEIIAGKRAHSEFLGLTKG
jgi:hypothetical protein